MSCGTSMQLRGIYISKSWLIAFGVIENGIETKLVKEVSGVVSSCSVVLAAAYFCWKKTREIEFASLVSILTHGIY